MTGFKRIELGIYNEVIYFINSSASEMLDAHEKLFDSPAPNDISGYSGGCFSSTLSGNDMVIIWVNGEKNIPHEAMHATQIIMKFVGIPLCDETSEAYAYLLGYIVGECKSLIN